MFRTRGSGGLALGLAVGAYATDLEGQVAEGKQGRNQPAGGDRRRGPDLLSSPSLSAGSRRWLCSSLGGRTPAQKYGDGGHSALFGSWSSFGMDYSSEKVES